MKTWKVEGSGKEDHPKQRTYKSGFDGTLLEHVMGVAGVSCESCYEALIERAKARAAASLHSTSFGEMQTELDATPGCDGDIKDNPSLP
jgi:hypothetical protein